MTFRFRKRIKLAPGVHINLSKSGISTSLGGKGLTVNVGRGRRRTTVGIPGTGLSHTTEHRPGGSPPSQQSQYSIFSALLVLLFLWWLFS